MTDKEANKIIAEYMGDPPSSLEAIQNEKMDGWIEIGRNYKMKYLSLDALIPVWEKLRTNDIHELALWGNTNGYWMEINPCNSINQIDSGFFANPQLSAIIATAKTVNDLKSSKS